MGQRKKRRHRLILAIILFVMFMAGIVMGTFQILNHTVRDFIVQNLDELAEHDMRNIRGYIERQWGGLRSLCVELEEEELTELSQVQKVMHAKKKSGRFAFIYLIDTQGRLYSDTDVYDANENPYLRYFTDKQSQFVTRYEAGKEDLVEENAYLLYGRDFSEEPLNVGGITFVGVIGMNDLSVIQGNMRISSFSGKGYSSVIDNEGNYIVSDEDASADERQSNFFELLKEAEFDDGLTAAEVKTQILGDEDTEFTCRSQNQRKYVLVKSMQDLDWQFVSAIETSVFQKQTYRFISITMGVVAALLFALTIVLIVYFSAYKKLKNYYSSVVEGVYSRQYYDDKLLNEHMFAFAVVDLDHLKYINDSLGHLAGDLAIEKVANVMLKNMGTLGDVVRYGGDEFILAFKKDISAERFVSHLEMMQQEVCRMKLDEYPDVRLTVSVGGCYQEGKASELFAKADMLLYEAKTLRNKVVTDVTL